MHVTQRKQNVNGCLTLCGMVFCGSSHAYMLWPAEDHARCSWLLVTEVMKRGVKGWPACRCCLQGTQAPLRLQDAEIKLLLLEFPGDPALQLLDDVRA